MGIIRVTAISDCVSFKTEPLLVWGVWFGELWCTPLYCDLRNCMLAIKTKSTNRKKDEMNKTISQIFLSGMCVYIESPLYIDKSRAGN